MGDLLKLCSCYGVAVGVLCLFLVVPLLGLWSVIVAYLDHTHLLFMITSKRLNKT